MARLALSIGGMVLGNLLLPGIGSALGGALGSYVGGLVDQQLFGSEQETRTVTGPRLQDLRVHSSGYGGVIPRVYGKARLSGNVIWMRGFHEETRTETQTVGGGGGGASAIRSDPGSGLCTQSRARTAVSSRPGAFGSVHRPVSLWLGPLALCPQSGWMRSMAKVALSFVSTSDRGKMLSAMASMFERITGRKPTPAEVAGALRVAKSRLDLPLDRV